MEVVVKVVDNRANIIFSDVGISSDILRLGLLDAEQLKEASDKLFKDLGFNMSISVLW